jgi:hypothetical protein
MKKRQTNDLETMPKQAGPRIPGQLHKLCVPKTSQSTLDYLTKVFLLSGRDRHQWLLEHPLH